MNFQLSSDKPLKEHKKRKLSSNREKYSCKLCHMTFFQNESLVKHMNKHSDPIKCQHCDYSTYSVSCMTRHLIKHGIYKKTYKCRYCDQIFKSIVSRKQHEITHTGIRCKICYKQFYSISKIRTHEQYHSELNVYKCGLCSKSYPHKYMLNSHVKSTHKKRVNKLGEISYGCKETDSDDNTSLFYCQFCPKVFKHWSWLQVHEKKHVEKLRLIPVEKSNLFSWEKNFQTDCILCGIPISSMRQLRVHVKTNHKESFGEGGYQNTDECSFCKKRISPGPDNFIHAIGHLGFKPFKCHICDYRTHWIKSIKIHLSKNHSYDDSLTCYKCDISFDDFELYKSHFKIEHNLEKARVSDHLLCHMCGKSFRSTNYFKRHLSSCKLIRSGKKSDEEKAEVKLDFHTCEICSDLFTSRKDLESHYLSHNNIQLHSCNYCYRMFLFKREYNEHCDAHSENLVCNDCGVEYDSYLMKMQHQKLCSLERLCSICDDFTASHGQYLSQHILSEHIDKSFLCDLCSICFASPQCFYLHLKSHSTCPEESSVSSSLYFPTVDSEEENLFSLGITSSRKKSLRSGGRFLFECDICGETFCTAGENVNHKANHRTILKESQSLPVPECNVLMMQSYYKALFKPIKSVTLFVNKSVPLSYSKKQFVLNRSKRKLTPVPNNNTVALFAQENVQYYQNLNKENDSVNLSFLKENYNPTIFANKEISENEPDFKFTRNTATNSGNSSCKQSTTTTTSQQKVAQTRPKNLTSSSTSGVIVTIDISDDDDEETRIKKQFPHKLQESLTINNNGHKRLATERIKIVNGFQRLIIEDCGGA